MCVLGSLLSLEVRELGGSQAELCRMMSAAMGLLCVNQSTRLQTSCSRQDICKLKGFQNRAVGDANGTVIFALIN